MSYNYTLKYRTFDQLLSDVRVDFPNLDLENLIDPQQLIKVVKRVNYDLGLRIQMTKQALLEVEKGRVKLPDDFNVLNSALICDTHTVTAAVPSGTHTEEVPLGVTPYQMTPATIDTCAPAVVNCCTGCNVNPCCCPDPEAPCETTTDACTKPRLILNCKDECFEVIQVANTISTTYNRILPIHILDNPKFVDCECPNIGLRSTRAEGWIENGFLKTNFPCGKVYIAYQGQMEDDEGNLLAPDHDMLNEYYEYAVKKRILENLIMNDQTVSQMKIQLIETGYRTSRNYALTIVNTPNFEELKKIHVTNRKMMYARYYDMFKSRLTYNNNINPNFFGAQNLG